MSLKTRLRISIVSLVTIVVVGLSALYLYDFTVISFRTALYRTDLVASQVKDFLVARLQERQLESDPRPASFAELKANWIESVRTDPAIPAMLERTAANTDVVLTINILGEDGTILAASSPQLVGTRTPADPDLDGIVKRNAFRNLWDLQTRQENYSQTIPLGVDGQQAPLFRVRAVVSSTFMRFAQREALRKIAFAFLLSLGIAILLAFFLASRVSNAIGRLGHRIDAIIESADSEPAPRRRAEAQEVEAVQSKLNLLGQQYRGAQEDASALRTNVQELLQRLEGAVLLLDPSGHITMAGAPAERLLAMSADQLVGADITTVFPTTTLIGLTIHDALRRQEAFVDRQISYTGNTDAKMKILVSLELLNTNQGGSAGALLRLKDCETRRQLELQIDVSTRLAAISRLTGGVAHEIKNPLNAMALHLEVLKSQMEPGNAEVEVISKEIKRLDNVVKTFLNFNQPIELQAKPLDLSVLAAEIVDLIVPEARLHGFDVVTSFDKPEWVNGDSDLLKQAFLNLVINAMEAMDDGGVLSIRTSGTGAECLIEIADSGPGIPPEIQQKIFNLYFTTKKTGSGIGLAMTFRVVQLHSGSIDLASEPGQGTRFQLRFPALSLQEEEVARRAYV